MFRPDHTETVNGVKQPSYKLNISKLSKFNLKMVSNKLNLPLVTAPEDNLCREHLGSNGSTGEQGARKGEGHWVRMLLRDSGTFQGTRHSATLTVTPWIQQLNEAALYSIPNSLNIPPQLMQPSTALLASTYTEWTQLTHN